MSRTLTRLTFFFTACARADAVAAAENRMQPVVILIMVALALRSNNTPQMIMYLHSTVVRRKAIPWQRFSDWRVWLQE